MLSSLSRFGVCTAAAAMVGGVLPAVQRGAENFPPAMNNSAQAFTRNVVGSMDYQPIRRGE
jgi:hypothetical protein